MSGSPGSSGTSDSFGVTRRDAGTTVAEMLIACALLSVLLLAATEVHASARRSAALSQELALRGQVAELAVELLHYHIALAGHGGVGSERELSGAALALGRGASQGGSDALAVRYVEERWYQEPKLRALRFDVKRDGNGLWNLYQQEEGATRQPAVQHVEGVSVERFVAPDGALLPGDSPLPLDATALELRLSFVWGETRSFTVALPGVQRVEAEAP
ncbi:MAG: hypothetical protein WD314_13145 [Trueperaceae bacterium]